MEKYICAQMPANVYSLGRGRTSYMNCVVKYYEQGTTARLIEGHTITLYIDVFDYTGRPVNLNHAITKFHLLESQTKDIIWSKECLSYYDISLGRSDVTYPFSVAVQLKSDSTVGLSGHYSGQLELINAIGDSFFPFQVEIIIDRHD